MSLDGTVVLLTGGTGLVGSHLAVDLLSAGARVLCLVRSTEERTARQRMGSIVRWFDMPWPESLELVEGTMEEDDFGLSGESRSRMARDVDVFVHCAADTSFAERHRERLERVNVQGPLRFLELLAGGRCRRVIHMSTAFVAGRQSGSCAETLHDPPGFHNVYEETKNRAEHLVHDFCKAHGQALTILRPSIVYGDSSTGRTFRFNGMYYPVRTILYIRDVFARDLSTREGRRAAAYGIHRDEANRLVLPLHVEEGGALNLIPVDYLVRYVRQVLSAPAADAIHHIVSPHRNTSAELFEYLQAVFAIRGIVAVPPHRYRAMPRTPLDRIFDTHLKMYKPYMNDTRVFEMSSLRTLPDPPAPPPALNSTRFARCMEYALSVDWGRTLDNP